MNDGIEYKVIVAKQAALQLVEHVEFLARVSIPAATRLTDDFERTYFSLTNNPHRCPVFNTKQAKKE